MGQRGPAIRARDRPRGRLTDRPADRRLILHPYLTEQLAAASATTTSHARLDLPPCRRVLRPRGTGFVTAMVSPRAIRQE